MRLTAHRLWRQRRASAAAVVGGLVAIACAAPAPQAARTGTSPAPEATAEATPETTARTCERERSGVAYEVAYPARWWTDPGSQRCRMFHPRPFDMPAKPRDVPGMAVVFDVADEPLEEATEPFSAEVRAEHRDTVDGRRAVTQQVELTDDTLFPEGTRMTRHLVAVGGRTLVASTTEHAAAGSYEANREVLAGMLERLRITHVAERPDR